MIQKSIFPEKDVTIFTLVGEANIQVFRKVLKEMYESVLVTKNIILDTRPATFSNPLENADVYALVEDLEDYPEPPNEAEKGKSAVIAETDLGFGIMRLFNSFAQFKRLPITLVPFRTLKSAYAYLDDDGK